MTAPVAGPAGGFDKASDLDENCIFCKIVAGDIPSRRIFENEVAVAFLDVSPWALGHTLVVPRRHVADVLADPPQLEKIGPAIDATTRKLMSKLDADGLNLLSSAGAVAGQEVFHLHVHLIPRYRAKPGLRNLIGPDPAAAADLDGLHARLTS